jgi:hypothetical protein
MSHPWSDSDDECRHAWSSNDEDSSSTNYEASNEAAPAAMLLDFLVELLLSRSITAKAFCVLTYYAGQCGVPGFKRFGKRPGLPSGHYQRHLNKTLAVFRDAAPEYDILVPCSNRKQPGRDKTWMPALVPQEELDAELREYHSWAEDLQSAIDEGALPPGYDNHPIVQASASPPVPIALFIDAVPYSNVDSLIGFWIVNLLSWRRHFIVGIRKSMLCRCGCKGWCTFWAVFFTCIGAWRSCPQGMLHRLAMMDALGARATLVHKAKQGQQQWRCMSLCGSKVTGRSMQVH